MNKKKLTKAIEISLALKPKMQTGRCFHTTFAWEKNKLLAIGVNNYTKPHPAAKFGAYKPTKEGTTHYQSGIHSEISALLKLGIENCSKIEFLNLRIDNNGNLGYSCPCPNCSGVLATVGFKKLFYFNKKKELCEFCV